MKTDPHVRSLKSKITKLNKKLLKTEHERDLHSRATLELQQMRIPPQNDSRIASLESQLIVAIRSYAEAQRTIKAQSSLILEQNAEIAALKKLVEMLRPELRRLHLPPRLPNLERRIFPPKLGEKK